MALVNAGLYESESDATAALKDFKAVADDGSHKTNNLKDSVFNLKNGFSGLWKSIKANPTSAILTGVTVAVTVINAISIAVKKHKEEIAENASKALESYQSQIDNLKSISDRYQELTEKYKTLSAGVNSLNDNVSLSNEEYDEYLDVCNELSDMFPDLIQGYDDQGRVILSCKGNVEELTKAYREMQEAANNAILASGNDVFKNFKNGKKDIESPLRVSGMEYVANSYTKYDIVQMLRNLASSSDIESAVSEYFGKSDPVSLTIAGQLVQALKDAGVQQQSDENGKDFLARALRENTVELNAYFSQFDQQIESAIQGTKSLAEAYLGNLLLNADEDSISQGVRQVARSIVSSFDYEFLRTFNSESEIYSYIDSLLNSLSGLTEKEQNSVQIAFNAKAAFNGGEISLGEYANRISGIEDILSKLPENVQTRIRLALNDSDYTKKVNKIKDGRSEDFKSWIDSLTKDDFEIVFDLVMNGGFNDLSSLQLQLARIKEASDNLNDALNGMSGRFSEAASAKSKYDEAMNAGEKNDNFKSMAEAYKKLNEEVESGTTNSNSFWAAAEYLFGSDKLEQWGYSVEKITSAMHGLTDVFGDSATGGYGFLDKLYALSTDGKVFSKTGDLLATIEKLDDGSWNFDINALNIDELASEMDMSTEAVLSCIQALSMYGDIDLYDLDEVLDAIQKIGMSTDAFNGTVINIDFLKNKMEELGYTGKDIYDLVENLRGLDGVTLFDINSDTDTLKQNILDIGIAEENAGNVQINTDQLIGLMNTLSFTKDNAKDLFEELSNSGNVSFTDANGNAITLTDSLEHLNNAKFDGVTSEFDSVVESADAATGKVNALQDAIDDLHGASVTIDVFENWVSSKVRSSSNGGSSGKIPAHASGTGGAPGGPTLTGEDGQELVRSGDHAYFVGTNGPEIVNLRPGDTVYNADETKRIKSGRLKIKGSIPSFASGTSGRLLRSQNKFAIAIDGSSGNVISGSAIAKKLKPYAGSKTDSSESSGSSSGGSSSGSSGSSDKPQAYDWIKVAIERIETAIGRLKTTATSAFKAIAPKLNASYDEISKINDEISIQEKGYARYLKQADSVGLDSGLAEKVRNGTIDINEYDSDTQSLITDYKKWYDAAEDCATAVQNLHENLASLYEENFNKVQTEYENQAKLLSHLESTYNSGMDLLDAKGYMVSASYYSALQDYEKQNISILNQELSDLTKKFSEAMASGEIEEYSDAWYSMQDSINGVKESLADANVQLATYAKEMRNVEWDRFDYVQDRISQITQESDFLIDLIGNSDLYTDKGQFNDNGRATLGLRAQNYNVYIAQANQYAKEILELDRDIASDPYNTDLIERREELLKLQQDSISSAEDEKQAIVSLVKDGIDKELESLKDLIDAYTDSLDSAKNLYDYQKKVTDKSSEISSLQKQLAAYSNDTSEETRAKIQKLQVELATAKEDLQETQYEQYITDQKKLLDNLYSDYEEILNQRLDNVDSLIGDMIDVVNENSGSINDTIIHAASEVGYTLTDNLRNIWTGSFDGVVTKYGDQFDTQLTSVNQVLNSIHANVAAMVASSDAVPSASASGVSANTTAIPTGKSASSTPTVNQSPASSASSAKKIVVGGKINAGNAKIYSYPGGGASSQYFDGDPIYIVLAESNGYLQVRHHNLSSGVTGWFKKSDVKAYRTGGLVDYTGLAKVDGTPGKPELMLNPADTQNFLNLRDALRAMATQDLSVNRLSGFQPPVFTGIQDISKRISTATSGNGAGRGDTTFGDVIIQIDHVEDYNDFVNQLKNDKQFERMVQAMTVDRVAGKSGFAKYNYRWKK